MADDKGGKDMAITQRTLEELRAKVQKISNRVELLTGKDNSLELDPSNPQHVEWHNEDTYKGK